MTNFVGEVKNENMVANGVMGISCSMLGKKFVEACLKYLEKYFDGNSWAGNGPAVITQILQKLCKTKKVNVKSYIFYILIKYLFIYLF